MKLFRKNQPQYSKNCELYFGYYLPNDANKKRARNFDTIHKVQYVE